jgi:tetratricopeptide (TPR) repeat protein
MMSLRAVSCLIALAVAATYARAEATDDAEAKKHYRVGLVALENNDLTVAADEFRQASQLAPTNALVHYYLAVVLSKQDKPSDGLQSLRKAIQLGLPEKESAAGEELEAKLTYALKRLQNLRIDWLNSAWGVSTSQGAGTAGLCHDAVDREWKLSLSRSPDGQSLQGTLTYTHTRTSEWAPVSPESPVRDCGRRYFQWVDTWNAVITQADQSGKANADFKYVGCNGACNQEDWRWNSWQSVIEKRGEDQIFVPGQWNGNQAAFTILDRLR